MAQTDRAKDACDGFASSSWICRKSITPPNSAALLAPSGIGAIDHSGWTAPSSLGPGRYATSREGQRTRTRLSRGPSTPSETWALAWAFRPLALMEIDDEAHGGSQTLRPNLRFIQLG
jgi:hypothetical protein